MHEMSIAMSIIDLATREAKKGKTSKVIEIELDIGTMSGIEVRALNFAMEMAVKDTMLETTSIRINTIEAIAECQQCGHVFKPDKYNLQCPGCRGLHIQIIKGREMQVRSLLIE